MGKHEYSGSHTHVHIKTEKTHIKLFTDVGKMAVAVRLHKLADSEPVDKGRHYTIQVLYNCVTVLLSSSLTLPGLVREEKPHSHQLV